MILPSSLCLPRPRLFQIRPLLLLVLGVRQNTVGVPGEVFGHQILESPKTGRTAAPGSFFVITVGP
jgi:hypothetical protein